MKSTNIHLVYFCSCKKIQVWEDEVSNPFLGGWEKSPSQTPHGKEKG